MTARRPTPRDLPPEADEAFGAFGEENEPEFEPPAPTPLRSRAAATPRRPTPKPPAPPPDAEPIFDPYEGRGVTPSGAPIDPDVQGIPIFGAMVQTGRVARIRVESLGPEGGWTYEGVMPADATEEMLINKWKRPGVFRLMAIDINNQPVSAPYQINISETNTTLLRTLASSNQTFGGGFNGGQTFGHGAAAAGANDPQIYAMLDKIFAMQERKDSETAAMIQNERMQAEQTKRDADEKMAAATVMIAERGSKLSEDIIAQQAELARKQQEIAAQNTNSLFATMSTQNDIFMQRMMATAQIAEREYQMRAEQERKRAELEIQRLKQESDLARQRAADEAQAERDRTRARLDEERQAMQERLALDRLNLEDRERLRAEQNTTLEAARERIRQEDQERQRRHEEMMEKHREEARKDERDRRAAIDALQQSKDPIGATLGMVTTIFGAAKKLGFDPAELLQGALTKTSSGWADVIKEGMGLAKEVVKTVNLSNGAMPDDDDDDEEDPNEVLQVTMPDGSVRSLTRAQLAQLQAQMAARQAQAQIPAGPPQQIQAPQPAGQQWAPPDMDPVMAAAMGMSTQFHPQHSQGQGMMAAVPGSAYPVQQQQQQQQFGYPGPTGQMPAPQFAPPPVPQQPQNNPAMRQASIAFVEQLESLPEPAWEQALMAWVINTGPDAVMGYLRAMTIRGALREGGASADMIEKVIALVNASPIVPADIPRG